MANIFNTVPVKEPNRMRNHLTPVNTMSFNFGGLYPIFCKTVLPGDRWSMSVQSFIRTVPLLSPVMSRNDIKIDAFFVPFRLIWKGAPDWHQMIDESLRRPMMYLDSNNDYNEGLYELFFGESSLNDYFGFASIPATELAAKSIGLHQRKVCALPFRAYRFIYDYYFRNKLIEREVTEDTGDPSVDMSDFYGNNDNVITDDNAEYFGPETDEWIQNTSKVFMRPWRRDIFTAALPDPQNGADVLIPQADIVPNGHLNLSYDQNTINNGDIYRNSRGDNAYDLRKHVPGEDVIDANSFGQSYRSGLKLDPTGPTIRQLRYANILEEFEEAQARGGSARGFKEWLRNIWGVKSSDARLDRPEYLGGYRGPIQISEVPQTSQGTESSPQGTLAGKGLSVGGNRLFGKRFFEEPGIIMCIMSVIPKTAYFQGDPREWLYDSPFDFPNPYFDHLGEQEVLETELNALAGLDSNAPKTFGYNIRNYEMKSYPDEIHGALRSSLSYWHEGRIFDWKNYPGLNVDFLKMRPADVSRIFPSTENSDKLIGQFFFDIRHKRRLSLYGLPKFS